MNELEKIKELFKIELLKKSHSLESIRFASAKKEYKYISIKYILKDDTEHKIYIYFEKKLKSETKDIKNKKICLGDIVKIINILLNHKSYEKVFLDVLNLKFYLGEQYLGDYIEEFKNHNFEIIRSVNNERIHRHTTRRKKR